MVASASMRIAPGTMVHVEAPHWARSGEDGHLIAGEKADLRTDIDVRTGADAETVSVQVRLRWVFAIETDVLGNALEKANSTSAH